MPKPVLDAVSRSALEDVNLSDVLMALVAANEEPLNRALSAALAQSRNFAKALDASTSPIRRKDLAARIGISVGNFNRLDPLVAGGWLRVAPSADGLVFRRSPVVDRLLRGRTVAQWEKSLDEKTREERARA